MGFQKTGESKKSPIWLWLAGFLFLALYFTLFPETLEKDFYFHPVKIEALTASPPPVQVEGFLFPFSQSFGQIEDSTGQFTVFSSLTGLSVSSRSYSFYDPLKQGTEIRSGGLAPGFIPGSAPAFWKGDRLFSFLPNRLGISEWGKDGKLLWSVFFPSTITALDANGETLALGLLDGRILVLNPKGESVWEYRPGASRQEVIYGVSVSENSRFLALLSGVEPRRFVLIEKMTEGYRPTFSKPLKDSLRRPTPLGFIAQDEYLFYTDESRVVVRKTTNNSEWSLPMQGELDFIAFQERHQLIVVISQSAQGRSFEVYSLDGTRLVNTPFRSQRFQFFEWQDRLYLGLDEVLMILEKSR